jgi:hypothetical protein
VIENVADVALAGTVIDAGTAASPALVLDKPTTAPPVGAGESRITTFDKLVPAPAMAEGASVTVSDAAVNAVCSTFPER